MTDKAAVLHPVACLPFDFPCQLSHVKALNTVYWGRMSEAKKEMHRRGMHLVPSPSSTYEKCEKQLSKDKESKDLTA